MTIIIKEDTKLERIFILQKPGAKLTLQQQRGIQDVIDKYDFKNFNSLKSIEFKEVDGNSFTVEVEEINNDWTKHLSRLLEIRVDLFEHKDKGGNLFISNIK